MPWDARLGARDVSQCSNTIQTRAAQQWVRCYAHLRESAARLPWLQRCLLPVRYVEPKPPSKCSCRPGELLRPRGGPRFVGLHCVPAELRRHQTTNPALGASLASVARALTVRGQR